MSDCVECEKKFKLLNAEISKLKTNIEELKTTFDQQIKQVDLVITAAAETNVKSSSRSKSNARRSNTRKSSARKSNTKKSNTKKSTSKSITNDPTPEIPKKPKRPSERFKEDFINSKEKYIEWFKNNKSEVIDLVNKETTANKTDRQIASSIWTSYLTTKNRKKKDNKPLFLYICEQIGK